MTQGSEEGEQHQTLGHEEGDQLQKLEQRLNETARAAENMFNWYNLFQHLAFWGSILASSAATIMAAVGTPKGLPLAIVTASGPAMLAARGYLKRGADWHELREDTARGFMSELTFEGGKTKEVSKRFREFETRHKLAGQAGAQIAPATPIATPKSGGSGSAGRHP